MSAKQFQVKLSGSWENYSEQEDKILKRAFMAGFPNARFKLRGHSYIYDFKTMKQINLDTKKEREIRPPHRWSAPAKPVVPAGPTMTIVVPPESPGKAIHVPHPKDKGRMIIVNVPARARIGQAMLVPVPQVEDCPVLGSVHKGDKAEVVGAPLGDATGKKVAKKGGWTTGTKVAAGVGGAAVVAGGAVLATEIAEHGADATFDAIGEGATEAASAIGGAAGDAGEAIGEFAGEAGDFLMDAADEVGDFIMELF